MGEGKEAQQASPSVRTRESVEEKRTTREEVIKTNTGRIK